LQVYSPPQELAVQRRLLVGRGRHLAELFVVGAVRALHVAVQFRRSRGQYERSHFYSLGIPRVISLLCQHSLINAYVKQQRPIQPKIVEDVAREFQLDEVEPITSPESLRRSAEIYNSESFIQSLGAALLRFRAGPATASSRDKK